jgi:hypothetical protein
MKNKVLTMDAMFMRLLAPALVISVASLPLTAAAQAPPVPDWTGDYLYEGRLTDGAAALEAHLVAQPQDDDARFHLGMVQFLSTVEGLGQAIHRHGAAPRGDFASTVPFLRLPVPPNPSPQPLDNAGLRAILEDFSVGLMEAETTLAGIRDPTVKIPLAIGLVRLDMDADGEASDAESLWRAFDAVTPGQQVTLEEAESFVLHLDAGDALWLRGYCNMLSAVIEIALAHDTSTLFEVSAHQFFPDTGTPMAAFPEKGEDSEWMEILDSIATIHALRLPVAEPARMARAHGHFLRVIELSGQTWDAYMAETDDDHEWIPNPSQTGVIPGAAVTAEMVEGWQLFLGEARQILEGHKLLPYWRGNVPGATPSLGISLHRVFHEPREFDLVLWVQGSAAIPYLEEGDVTEGDFWRHLNRAFSGQLFGFALWFN